MSQTPSSLAIAGRTRMVPPRATRKWRSRSGCSGRAGRGRLARSAGPRGRPTIIPKKSDATSYLLVFLPLISETTDRARTVFSGWNGLGAGPLPHFTDPTGNSFSRS